MTKTTIKIEGMSCPMCESHINDVIRKTVQAKKVNSSHRKGEAILISETEPDGGELRKAIDATGYRVLDISSEPYVKKGLFGR